MESDELLQEADKWLAEVEMKFPKRNYTSTVVNLEGITILATRYIKALKAPEEISEGGDVCVCVTYSVIMTHRYLPVIHC